MSQNQKEKHLGQPRGSSDCDCDCDCLKMAKDINQEQTLQQKQNKPGLI